MSFWLRKNTAEQAQEPLGLSLTEMFALLQAEMYRRHQSIALIEDFLSEARDEPIPTTDSEMRYLLERFEEFVARTEVPA